MNLQKATTSEKVQLSGTVAGKKGTFFQPKLNINQPNDVYEREADNVADKVMQAPIGDALQHGFFKPAPVNINRKCQDGEAGRRLMGHELTPIVQQNNSQASSKIIQRQDDAPHASNLQITKRLELPAPTDSLPTVESSPEHHDAEGAHLGVDLASGVSANPALSLTPQTYSFSLVCRDCNLYSGSDDAPISFDFIHEPNFQLSLSPDPHNAQIYQAAVSLVNIHFRRHRQEFIEVGLSPQLAYAQPSGTLTAGAQVQVEWHVTSRFSLTASSAISATRHDDSAPPDYGSVPLGTGHGLDWSWAPLSIGALVHFD